MDFQVVSEFKPTGHQPEAIRKLADGFRNGNRFQTLLGVTGSGKTFTMAHIIQELQMPALIMAHNKTLAAQLYNEFKTFFPHNAVEYFVSYYDYYQPEAYVPSKDIYIEKDSSINEEIDRLRHSATSALFERKDVIIIASVSCIYGLGDPENYKGMLLSLRRGMVKDRDEVLRRLVEIQYNRNDISFTRSTFRVRGDVVEIFPAYTGDTAFRVEFFGDEIEKITEIDVLTGEIMGSREHVAIFPATHHVTPRDKLNQAIRNIEEELDERLKVLKEEEKLVEAQRLSQRTLYDLEMLQEIGFCSGVENYSRHLALEQAGCTPKTLLDYFPEDFVVFIDESHVAVSQIRGMYEGDRSRKQTLVDYGFRLPSALDNRPLKFNEFESKTKRTLFVSATPAVYEREHSNLIVEQIIRPTGLIDPEIIIKPIAGQIDDLIGEINKNIVKNQKTLVTTLTIKMSEDLTRYLKESGIRVRYLHSEIHTLERLEIIRDLRMDVFDVLIGINLLREGLDIPEVSLVAILDADKDGLFRNETALIQTIGRAARHVEGRVVMYADSMTKSMQKAISETNRRRAIQIAYNEENGITPSSIEKKIHELIKVTVAVEDKSNKSLAKDPESMNKEELLAAIKKLEKQMRQAAADLQFEQAAALRDEILGIKRMM